MRAVELAELKPRDRIDIQSFIWIIGDYKEESEKPQTRKPDLSRQGSFGPAIRSSFRRHMVSIGTEK
jgi:hypothetical protein